MAHKSLWAQFPCDQRDQESLMRSFSSFILFIFFSILASSAWADHQLSPQEQEGLDFLNAYMPVGDLKALKSDFLSENVRLAYQAVGEVPWGKDIPKDIFLNDILPYVSLNERREDWRGDFHRRFIEIARNSKTIDQAVLALNKYVFDTLKVSYSPTLRPKPDQSPY